MRGFNGFGRGARRPSATPTERAEIFRDSLLSGEIDQLLATEEWACSADVIELEGQPTAVVTLFVGEEFQVSLRFRDPEAIQRFASLMARCHAALMRSIR